MNLDHPQTSVFIKFEADVEIAPLLIRLWNLGFITQYSCQNNFGVAYILFPILIQAKTFAIALDLADIEYEASMREDEWGGGASIKFRFQDLAKVTELFNNINRSPLNDDPYKRKLYNEYTLSTKRLKRELIC